MRYKKLAVRAFCALLLAAAASTQSTAYAQVTAPRAVPVTASDGNYTYDSTSISFSLNVLENLNVNGGPLVDGQPRPLQLINATSMDPGVQVTVTRNCVNISITGGQPAPFKVAYTVVDGNLQPMAASGFLNFAPSATASFTPATDPTCGDPQFKPTAGSDFAQTAAGQPVLIPVLSNDTPGAPGRQVLFPASGGTASGTQVTGGSVAVQPDSQILFTPNSGFVGTSTFEYILGDYVQPGFEVLNVHGMVTVNVAPGPTNQGGGGGQILVNGSATNTLVPDSNGVPGETVAFEAVPIGGGTATNITDYAWFVDAEQTPRAQGPSNKFSTSLSDGAHFIKVVASNGTMSQGNASVNITVGASTRLAQLPNLQPNQMGVAKTLDRICGDPSQTSNTGTMTADQQDILARCNDINAATPANQMRALDELTGKDFNGSHTQTRVFTRATYSGVTDRLMALRSGARGVNLSGVKVSLDGKAMPVADLEKMASTLLGGAAGADDEPGSLLGDRWGLWTRGNVSVGSKEKSNADGGFRASQLSGVLGMDYRVTNNAVVGSALSFGSSTVNYNPTGEGGLDTRSMALAVYGSGYALQNGYLDAVVNVARSTYQSRRHIFYQGGAGIVDRNAKGSTSGMTFSGGLSGGYDFIVRSLTISPNASLFYSDSGIDAFREFGARGLDLMYDDQSFKSATGTLGLRITYAVSLPWGVVVPYLRGDYVHELQGKVEVFNVRFANDTSSSSDPIAVTSDTPDQSYWRLSGGMTAQFPFGLSSYIEYQRLQSFEFLKFTDIALGLRMQYRF